MITEEKMSDKERIKYLEKQLTTSEEELVKAENRLLQSTAFTNEIKNERPSSQFEPLVRQLPPDEEIGKIVQEIAYKQHHEEQADDFIEKVWILKEWLSRQSA